MTTSFAESRPARRGPSPAAAVTVAVIATASVLTLIVAGLTLVGLAIAFPIAIPIAEAYHLPVKAADAALASQVASVWWVFAPFAIASFVAAGAVVVKAIGLLSPSPRD